mmetsp:Transcript_20906/g.30273  ORF Transcript_20906/g.30273 Transcript_20906/m.30273 type:complete len:333 (+) Transcript_20906:583-1581(+)
MVETTLAAGGGCVDSALVELHLVRVDAHRQGTQPRHLRLQLVVSLGCELCPAVYGGRERPGPVAEDPVQQSGPCGHGQRVRRALLGNRLLGGTVRVVSLAHDPALGPHVLVGAGDLTALTAAHGRVTGRDLLLGQQHGAVQLVVEGPGALNVLHGRHSPAVPAGALVPHPRHRGRVVAPVKGLAGGAVHHLAAEVGVLDLAVVHKAPPPGLLRAAVLRALVHVPGELVKLQVVELVVLVHVHVGQGGDAIDHAGLLGVEAVNLVQVVLEDGQLVCFLAVIFVLLVVSGLEVVPHSSDFLVRFLAHCLYSSAHEGCGHRVENVPRRSWNSPRT